MELRDVIAQQPLLGPFSMRNYFLAAKLEGRGLAGNKAMIRRLITMGFIAVARINHLAQLSHCELANLLLHYSLTLKGSRSAWCLRKNRFSSRFVSSPRAIFTETLFGTQFRSSSAIISPSESKFLHDNHHEA